MTDTVLVVGAGPTALALATELRRHGISCRIIDRAESRPAHQARALTMWDGAFDVLRRQGTADRIRSRGNIDGVVDRLPLVAALIAVVTFVILFVMTGSVIAPLKATILNLLSLSVMFGVLVWGFQNGHLTGILDFTPTGLIEPSIPIVMFCIAYGLSMDYGVFLLSRIKEEFDRTGDAKLSVVQSIARSSPLVTTAAVILAVSFAVYATSGVTFLQQLGVGMALTVLVDATVVRGVLVPAFMRLAGPWNWWAPAFLRRLHARLPQLSEPVVVPAEGPERQPVPGR